MRATFLLSTFILFAAPTFAQQDSSKFIYKGQWVGNGSLSYSTARGENPMFEASASVGYLVLNRLAFGIDAGYTKADNTLKGSWPFPVEYTDNYSLLSGSIFSRFYIRVKRFAPYAEVQFGGIRSTHETYRTITYNEEFYKAGIGFSYFITPGIAFNGNYSWTYFPGIVNYYASYKQTGEVSRSLNLGLQIYLSRNQGKRFDQNNFTFPRKGSWLLGGAIGGGEGIRGTSDHGYTIGDVNGYGDLIFSSEVGYFLARQFVMGLRLSETDIAKISTINVNLFTRYYLLHHRLTPFVETSIGYGNSSTSAISYHYPSRFGSIISLQAGVGTNYFITNSIAIESKLSINTFELMSNLQVGFQFFVGRK